MKALSIRQPCAWAILHAGKDIENRDWGRCAPWRRFRGRILLHASSSCTSGDYLGARDFIESRFPDVVVPPANEIARGAIVGAMTIADCVSESSSPWFFGPYGLVLESVVALEEPIPCKGALGFFNVTAEVEAEIRRRFQ